MEGKVNHYKTAFLATIRGKPRTSIYKEKNCIPKLNINVKRVTKQKLGYFSLIINFKTGLQMVPKTSQTKSNESVERDLICTVAVAVLCSPRGPPRIKSGS